MGGSALGDTDSLGVRFLPVPPSRFTRTPTLFWDSKVRVGENLRPHSPKCHSALRKENVGAFHRRGMWGGASGLPNQKETTSPSLVSTSDHRPPDLVHCSFQEGDESTF